jgi:hypothetical protein
MSRNDYSRGVVRAGWAVWGVCVIVAGVYCLLSPSHKFPWDIMLIWGFGIVAVNAYFRLRDRVSAAERKLDAIQQKIDGR